MIRAKFITTSDIVYDLKDVARPAKIIENINETNIYSKLLVWCASINYSDHKAIKIYLIIRKL